MNINDPAGAQSSTYGFGAEATGVNEYTHQPQFHDTALAQGFKRVRPLASTYILDVTIKNTSLPDYILAWRFVKRDETTQYLPDQSVGQGIIKAASAAGAVQTWAAVRMNAGWYWRRFSGVDAGGSIYPTTGKIKITVPSIFKLGKKLNRSIEVGDTPTVHPATLPGYYEHELAAADWNQKYAFGGYFLVLNVFKHDGSVIGTGEIVIDYTVHQKARLFRDPVGLAGAPEDQPNTVADS